ncbi:hypothetical protein [Streptomyces sp. 147326]|uniref:hypothetical protein n=1 Tax=Streptomyces sp. 147326 TaxID=3074379 RepID=UPI0038572AA9
MNTDRVEPVQTDRVFKISSVSSVLSGRTGPLPGAVGARGDDAGRSQGRLDGLPPASLQLLAAHDEELRARQHALEQVRQQIHSLLPLYRANLSEAEAHAPVQRIDSLEAVRGILGQSDEGAAGVTGPPGTGWSRSH